MSTIALAFDNPRLHTAPMPGLESDRLADIINQLSIGIGIEDENGVLTRCNQAFADYYTVSAIDLVGLAFMDRMELICPHVVEVNGQPVLGDAPMAAFFSCRVMQHDARGVIETTLRDGRSFRHERKSLADGGRLVTISNVTALKRLEAEARAVEGHAASSQAPITPADDVSQTREHEPACLETLESLGGCTLDLGSARLFNREGDELPITAMEFSLLRVFVENCGRILNRDQLLADAHDKGWEPFDRSIDLRISRIRRKIEINPAKPQIIRTVRGLGYIMD